MKTYVIIVSERFPATHERAGELTYFPTKIMKREKIHTIRANFPLWEKRIKEVEQGNACLSIRVWDGKPYRSKQKELFKFSRFFNGVGIQKIDDAQNFVFASVDNNTVNWADIAKNDGLSFSDFDNWFRDYDLTKPLAIIHFTPFRY